jgi:glycosyltransferase involved in cell wall biosynthesis
MSRKSVLFVGFLFDGWGGSEELWSRTALRLAAEGFAVAASVHNDVALHPRVQALTRGGVEVRPRISRYSLSKRLWRRATFKRDTQTVAEVRKLIDRRAPSLVVLSSGGVLLPVELLEFCLAAGVPFATIAQANTEASWPEDAAAARYHKVVLAAARCYFVSTANWRLFEKQLGFELPNAEVVRNPFNVNYHASPPWPQSADGAVLFACVARLHPPSKGQDILLEALATPAWMDRKWRLTLYGEGPMKISLQRLVHRLGLTDRVIFAGHVAAIEDIWASNQVLVMPSRLEGLPLAMVEAMLCGRPTVATNVAGHPEILEDGVTGFLAEAPTVPAMLKALERFWERRAQGEQMGKVASERIRLKIPPDPIAEFAGKLKKLIGPLQNGAREIANHRRNEV